MVAGRGRGCGDGPERAQRRLRQRAVVQPSDPSPTLRRLGGDRGRAARRRTRSHAIGDSAGAGRRRLVPPGRLPPGLDRARLGRAWRESPTACASWASPRPVPPADADRGAARCDSPLFRAGAFYPRRGDRAAGAARPRTCGRRFCERRVEIFERTVAAPPRRRGDGRRGRVRHRRVRAGAVVATGGALAGLPGHCATG